jgi:hypothetical protein
MRSGTVSPFFILQEQAVLVELVVLREFRVLRELEEQEVWKEVRVLQLWVQRVVLVAEFFLL